MKPDESELAVFGDSRQLNRCRGAQGRRNTSRRHVYGSSASSRGRAATDLAAICQHSAVERAGPVGRPDRRGAEGARTSVGNCDRP